MKKEWKLNIILFRFARSILLLSSTSFRFNTKLLSNGSEGYSKKRVLIYCNCFPSGILPALWISTDVLIAPVLVTYGNLIRAEVSFSLHEDTLRMLLTFTTKANERKRRQTSTKNHRKNFGAVKKTREQIFTFGFRSILQPLHDEICPAQEVFQSACSFIAFL